MDWITPASGFIGAVIGAGASSITAVRVLKAQLSDAREARADAERASVVASLAKALEALDEQARIVPEEIRRPEGEDAPTFRASQRETEKQWEAAWHDRLRAVKVGALEIKDEKLRDRLLDGIRYSESLHMLEYATHNHGRRWVLRGLVEDMTQCLFAWRRDEGLPEPQQAFTEAKESFEVKVEEWEMIAEAEEADRQQRRSQRQE